MAASETKSSEHAIDLVAVAHPDLGLLGDTGEQVGRLVSRRIDRQFGAAVLARRSALHLPAHGLADQLHAVADAQHGNAQLEDFRIALRRALGVDARRAAGEDQPLRRKFANPLGCDVVPHDLAVDVLLADAAGDELHILGAEIEHEHPLGSDITGGAVR